MSHLFEPATTGRAKCRGCGRAITKGELRFGERLPNAFAEGEMMIWFHPMCAAYKRPDAVLQTLDEGIDAPNADELERIAKSSLEHRRLPRIDGAEKSPSAQAKCRHCYKPIARGAWRIRLVFYQDGMFSPGGYIHLECREPYFETADILEHVLHFSPGLTVEDLAELTSAFNA